MIAPSLVEKIQAMVETFDELRSVGAKPAGHGKTFYPPITKDALISRTREKFGGKYAYKILKHAIDHQVLQIVDGEIMLGKKSAGELLKKSVETRQEKQRYRNKNLDCLRAMPPLAHYPDRDEPFDPMKSEVVDWAMKQPQFRQWIADKLTRCGYIAFDPTTKLWSGVPETSGKPLEQNQGE